MQNPEQVNKKIMIIAAPKSGGTYVRSELEKNLNLEYIRVTDGIFPKSPFKLDKLEQFYLNNSITHTHSNADELNILTIFKTVERFIFHVRDPRNILVSWIHHFDNCNLPQHAQSHICHLHLITQYFPYFGEKYTSLSFDQKFSVCYDFFYKELLSWLQEWFLALNIDFSKDRNKFYSLQSKDYAKNKYALIEDIQTDVLLTTHEDLLSQGSSIFFDNILEFFSIPKSYWRNIVIQKNMSVNFRTGKINSWKEELSLEQQNKLTNLIPKEWFDFFKWKK